MGKKRDIRQAKPLVFLGLFAIGWWAIPSSYKILTKSAFTEFHAPIWEISSRVDDLSNYWGHLSDSKQVLISKGKEFTRLTADLEIQNFTMVEKIEEIKRLKEIKSTINILSKELNLNQSQQFESILARVSIRKMSSWRQELTIRKGKEDQLIVGNGVIFNGGLVGRIVSVESSSSNIELITNPSFRIVAHFLGDKRPVTFQGNGVDVGGQPSGIVFDVPHDLKPTESKPLKLVSSSLGGNYPNGVPIGTVFKLEGGQDGLFQSGKVILDRRINEIQEVTILKPQ